MKNITSYLTWLCALVGFSAAFAGEKPATDSYTQAVTAYVNAAGQQLHAIRGEVDAATKNATEAVKQKYAGVYAQLDRCDKMLGGLKAAGQKDFDPLKAKFEQGRNKMVKLLEAARRAEGS